MSQFSAKISIGVYKPRNPKASGYYKCVENHFEELEATWDEKYAPQYGFWRPYVMNVIYQYLDCGDLHFGFARIRCEKCGHEHLLAFSCKRRHFCPSCHQKRVVEYGEWLLSEVLKDVVHRHWVFSLPKRLRIYFIFDRKLLSELSRCAYNVINRFFKTAVSEKDARPGASISVHTFGDFLNINPNLHAIVTDGFFLKNGSFQMAPEFSEKDLEEAFQYEVLKMLKKHGKINAAVIENMLSWRHSGFHVHTGHRIWPDNDTGLANLAKYIVRACFSQERMIYNPAQKSSDSVATVVYKSKDGRTREMFNAVDWLARLVVHIPGRYEHTIRYYGFYSNKSRGLRKKKEVDNEVPAVIPSELPGKAFKKNWARLIQKIYEADPLTCPKCQCPMRIISIIDRQEVIRKILKHLDLWETHNHDPPDKESTDGPKPVYDPSYSQIPLYDIDWS